MQRENEYAEYISKLIDRNIKKEQASGFTSWAMLGVFFYFLFELFDNIPVALIWPHFKMYPFILIVLTIDFFLFLLLFVISLANLAHVEKKRKILTKLNEDISLHYYIGMLFFILSYSNIKTGLILNNKNVLEFPFYVWGLFLFTNGLAPYIQNIANLWKKYQLKKTIIKFNSGSQIENKITTITILIGSFVSILILLYYALTIEFNLTTHEILYYIKIGIEICTLFTLSFLLLAQFVFKKRNTWLENLEQEIYMYELNDTEIKERFENEYIGQSIEKWFSKERRELELIHTVFEESYQKLNLHIEKMSLIQQIILDKNFEDILYELKKLENEIKWFEEERKAIMKTVKHSMKSYVGLISEINLKLDSIGNKSLNPQERKEIVQIGKYYIEVQESIEKQTNLLFERVEICLESSENFWGEIKEKTNT
ncbi:hypothetical protein [Methanolobus profundi]|uniref:Uncharacterized protein n=1 Tax=Methanolobus profundi TaxID=487685 RepID=A0A1I4U3D6_9EURY|nr:hypothetical protein [Methanolobus profundi]SFM83556.1 hypothetical protein SAMN04488696_2537 [Methanolobus profundi]